MRKRLIGIVASLAAALALVAPGIVVAETTTTQQTFSQGTLCVCFCASPQGATDISKGQKVPAARCVEECAKPPRNAVVAACATSVLEYPDRNLNCYTSEQCAAEGGKWDIEQAEECPANWRHCFAADPEPIPLTVQLGGRRTVSNIADFINALYKSVLGVATAVAIVMIMIGGTQYVIGAGGGSVESAKTRIKNAVIGLVLLLAVTLLLTTVSPSTTKLQVPQFPKIKRVETLNDQASCEKLRDELGFKINDANIPKAKQVCGTSTEVLATKGGTAVSGQTCDFKTCPEPGTACYGSGAQAKCLACEQVHPSIGGFPQPSPGVCAQLALESTDKIKYYCSYTQDATFLGIADAAKANIIERASSIASLANEELSADARKYLTAGACVKTIIDCNTIKKCEDYDSQVVGTKASSPGSYGIKDTLDDLDSALAGSVSIKTICQQNPCGLHKGDPDKACWFVGGLLEGQSGLAGLAGSQYGSGDYCFTVERNDEFRDKLLEAYDAAAALPGQVEEGGEQYLRDLNFLKNEISDWF